MSSTSRYHFNSSAPSGQASTLNWPWRRTCLNLGIAMIALAFVTPLLGSPFASAAAGPDPQSGAIVADAASAFSNSSEDELREILRQIRERLKAAGNEVNDRSGPLPEPDASGVLINLDVAEAMLDQIRDPGQEPSLSPADVGFASPYAPTSPLATLSDDCLRLAESAYLEALNPVPNHVVIGSDLKGIRKRLDDYRARVVQGGD